jgi:hypothetical protein
LAASKGAAFFYSATAYRVEDTGGLVWCWMLEQKFEYCHLELGWSFGFCFLGFAAKDGCC